MGGTRRREATKSILLELIDVVSVVLCAKEYRRSGLKKILLHSRVIVSVLPPPDSKIIRNNFQNYPTTPKNIQKLLKLSKLQ